MKNIGIQSGKVLVMGASGGVGRCLVRQLLEHGYEVIGSALDQADIENTIKDGLEGTKFFVANFTDAEVGGAQVRAELSRDSGPVSAVISCVGVNPCGPLETTPISEFRRAMEINAASNLAVYQVTLPYLTKSKGRFIFVGSMAGKVSMPLLGYYNASKYALEGLVDTMRLEAGQWDVPVSLIQPGAISTGMVHGFGEHLDARLAELDEEGRENYCDYFSQHQAIVDSAGPSSLEPNDVAATIIQILQAATPESRYPIGGAVDFLEKRKLLSDDEMDAFLSQFLPGRRAP